ncbi:hypothetical protein BGZ65_008351 [Modicella reniformis]|uniref:Uncharacterized protein n=1 Tax=Modicella reniformis TaxID=1440133 RepID=A0A9P6IIH0_9FUNG|nr:hypothetical protein BGZ65_008351 [Modicella reniformis]
MPGSGGAGFAQAVNVNGYNTALLTPALSTHSSTSSVPTLSMVMGSPPVTGTDGGIVMMDPMYQAQTNDLISDAPTQTMTPSGSPAFQPAAPTTILRSTTPTTVPMTMPMSMSMTVSGISLSHPAPAMLTMSIPSAIINMGLVQDSGPGGSLYMISNDQHASVTSSSMDATGIVVQSGLDLVYGPMPVDPQQM